MPDITVAYLVNRYPTVSHSFIRREILALERQGVKVVRLASRGWDLPLPDAQDQAERTKTRYGLQGGLLPLLLALLRTAAGRPAPFWRALKLAIACSRSADSRMVVHMAYLAQACLYFGWLREAGASHVHAHFGTNPAEVAMLIHALGGPPYSFTVHGPEEFDRPMAIGLPRKIANSRFVAAVSSFGRSQLYRWAASADWPRIQVVRCGLDEEFHSVEPTPSPTVPQLVCVGRLCEQKGQLLLIQALEKLVRTGIDVRLVLAGDGEMRGELEDLANRLGVADRVTVTGWIDGARVREEILAARALVLPSFAEGLPVVLMEALSLRRPVISTFVAGIPELVRDGENGWLVPAGDVDALAAAMRQCVLADPGRLDAMGLAGRDRVLRLHSVDREASKLVALFSRAVEPAAAPSGSRGSELPA